MKFGTKLIHNAGTMDERTGALAIPVYRASTFHQSDVDDPPEFDYSRSGNPTRKALEETVALLEGGSHGYAFASGMAATSAALSIFSAGDHVIVCRDVYGGTFRAVNTIFSRFGIEFSLADATDPEQIRGAIRPNTKGLFLETPSNPLMKITDLRAAAAIAKAHNIVTIADNTFMSPYLQRPLEHGVDIVVHSATKFLGGHSDVLAGLAVTADDKLARRIYRIQNGLGAVLGPEDCFLLQRGIKTLKVRLDAQQKTAQTLAQWLSAHPKVRRVYYPGLEGYPGGEIHIKQAEGFGAVLSFEALDDEAARRFLRSVKLAAVAVSLGGVETIASYPARMSHSSVPPEERERLGITGRLIRISAGLEDAEDLMEDFDRALQ
jgi:cystathionine beta-lyase/cystathionine gamma-synthase